MEKDTIGFVLQEPRTDRDATIDASIKQTFKALSVLAGHLIEEAKKKTKTRGEYIAFLEGANYIFYKVCKRDDVKIASSDGGLTTLQDAVIHCFDLLPFMDDAELEEHLKLIGWFNELLQFKGEKPIPVPDGYLDNDRIAKAIIKYRERQEKSSVNIKMKIL